MTARFRSSIWILFCLLASPAFAERPRLGPGKWSIEMAEIDAKLRTGKWKAGKRAGKLAKEVLSSGWHDPGLVGGIACRCRAGYMVTGTLTFTSV